MKIINTILVILAVALFISAPLAFAQTQITPTPHTHGSHRGLPSPLPVGPEDLTRRERFPYVPQTKTWPVINSAWYTNHSSNTDYTSPQLGDGTLPHGGTAPFYYRGSEPPIIPSNFPRDGWWFAGGSVADAEAKFRTHCDYSHSLWEDPIVYPNRRGIYGNSHLHSFFGNTKMNADSTYQTLRTTGESTCNGGPLNRSGYWYPAILKDNALGDGKTMINKPEFAVVYYTTSMIGQDLNYRFPRGFQYVAGFNVADPTGSVRQAIIDDAKAQSIAGGGFGDYSEQINHTVAMDGFIGWKCEATIGGTAPGASPVPGYTQYQPYLRNDDGTPTLVCPTNELIGFVINTQGCWDGYNLWSPDGRSHVMSGLRNTSGRSGLCPNGWYKLVSFELIVWFRHAGSDDYKEWYASSDRIPGGTTFKNGQTMHSDWYGAWDYEIMSAWMKNCNGITFEDGTGDNPQECNDSTLGDGRQLRNNNPPNRKLLDLTVTFTDTTRWEAIPDNR